MEDEIPVEFFFVDGFGNWIVEIGKRKLPGDCTQVSPQNNGTPKSIVILARRLPFL